MMGFKGVLMASWAGLALLGLGAEERMGQAVLLGTNVVAIGRYPSTEERTARVKIQNAGQGALRIVHVVATCKCMRVDAYPRSLAPGETGEVAVSIKRDEISGVFERSFFIETDDPGTRLMKIKVTGEATVLGNANAER